jgi:hypothetical protein
MNARSARNSLGRDLHGPETDTGPETGTTAPIDKLGNRSTGGNQKKRRGNGAPLQNAAQASVVSGKTGQVGNVPLMPAHTRGRSCGPRKRKPKEIFRRHNASITSMYAERLAFLPCTCHNTFVYVVRPDSLGNSDFFMSFPRQAIFCLKRRPMSVIHQHSKYAFLKVIPAFAHAFSGYTAQSSSERRHVSSLPTKVVKFDTAVINYILGRQILGKSFH